MASGPGGVLLSGLTANPAGGYDDAFDISGLDDTFFAGIEHFTFIDKVGGDDNISTGVGDDVLKGEAARMSLADRPEWTRSTATPGATVCMAGMIPTSFMVGMAKMC